MRSSSPRRLPIGTSRHRSKSLARKKLAALRATSVVATVLFCIPANALATPPENCPFLNEGSGPVYIVKRSEFEHEIEKLKKQFFVLSRFANTLHSVLELDDTINALKSDARRLSPSKEDQDAELKAENDKRNELLKKLSAGHFKIIGDAEKALGDVISFLTHKRVLATEKDHGTQCGSFIPLDGALEVVKVFSNTHNNILKRSNENSVVQKIRSLNKKLFDSRRLIIKSAKFGDSANSAIDPKNPLTCSSTAQLQASCNYLAPADGFSVTHFSCASKKAISEALPLPCDGNEPDPAPQSLEKLKKLTVTYVCLNSDGTPSGNHTDSKGVKEKLNISCPPIK